MNSIKELWDRCFSEVPLIAILRGIQPNEVLDVGTALFDAGIRIVEVPLNSPDPMVSIEQLSKTFQNEMVVGAGTVLTKSQVANCISAGGQLIVAPNLDEEVANAAKEFACLYCPGVGTPTEAFKGLSLGAMALKLFPGELITPPVVKAMRAVLPKDCQLLPVGGVNLENLEHYCNAGANGFGIGSALYSPGKSASDVARDAGVFVSVMKGLSVN